MKSTPASLAHKCALSLACASALACAPARAEQITIVVSGLAGDPSLPDYYFHIENTVSVGWWGHIVGQAFPSGSEPIKVGDELRVLLTFDTGSSSVSDAFCGNPGLTRAFGQATGSVTFGGVVATLAPDDNWLKSAECFSGTYQYTVLVASLTGAPLTSVTHYNPNIPEPVALQMPLRNMALFLIDAIGANCTSAESGLPLTAEAFVGNCGHLAGNFRMEWRSEWYLNPADDNTYGAVFSALLQNLTLSLPTTEDFVDQLVAEVVVLNLDQGIENSLDAKIAQAVAASDNIAVATYTTSATQKAAAKSNAKNKLDAFINEVNAQRGKKIPDDKATRLVLLATNLAARL